MNVTDEQLHQLALRFRQDADDRLDAAKAHVLDHIAKRNKRRPIGFIILGTAIITSLLTWSLLDRSPVRVKVNTASADQPITQVQQPDPLNDMRMEHRASNGSTKIDAPPVIMPVGDVSKPPTPSMHLEVLNPSFVAEYDRLMKQADSLRVDNPRQARDLYLTAARLSMSVGSAAHEERARAAASGVVPSTDDH